MEVWSVDMGGGKSSSLILGGISPTLTTTHYGEPVVAYDDALVFDARGNGNGKTCCSIVGGHQDRITDYTAIVVEEKECRHIQSK